MKNSKLFETPLTDAELDDLVFSLAIEADELVAVSARPIRRTWKQGEIDVLKMMKYRDQ